VIANENPHTLVRPLIVGVVVALIASMGASAWASCFAGPELSAAMQMACCKAGHDKCPMHGSAKDCCRTKGPQSEQDSLAAQKQGRSIVTAQAAVSVTLPQTADIVSWDVESIAFSRSLLRSTSPPHLLVAALLI